MNISSAISYESFIFAQGEDLKTTSLKVAEAFNKRHADILRSVEKVLTQVSDLFGERNFALVEYEQQNNLGLMVKYPMYEMTKDGFMFLVMGFTGKTAAAIKESYINAFNVMYDKLFPKTQYGLKQLPPSPYITGHEAQQFKKSLEYHCKGNGKLYSALYHKVWEHYGMESYKMIPAGKLCEAAQVAGIKLVPLFKAKLKPEQQQIIMTQLELDQKIAEAVGSVQGELVNEPQHNQVTITLAPLVDGKMQRYLITHHGDNMVMFWEVTSDTEVKRREHFIRDLKTDGYIVIEKSKLEMATLKQLGTLLA